MSITTSKMSTTKSSSRWSIGCQHTMTKYSTWLWSYKLNSHDFERGCQKTSSKNIFIDSVLNPQSKLMRIKLLEEIVKTSPTKFQFSWPLFCGGQGGDSENCLQKLNPHDVKGRVSKDHLEKYISRLSF